MVKRATSGVLVLTSLFGFACAGWFESTAPDPITVSFEDGGTRTITQGEQATHPADFPLPAPPDRTPATSILADGEGASTVTYRLDSLETASEMIAFYQAWFEAEGLKPRAESSNLAGMKSTTLTARRGKRVLTVAVMDGMGTRMLTLTDRPAP